jgi:serine/threonine protein kinase
MSRMTLSDSAVARLRDAVERPALPERYAVHDIIGRGGMGVVWRARDIALDRDVAVKVIASHAESAALGARLTREARILARLEHPGIVAVHDVGMLDDGRTWCVMRLVRGTRLDTAAAGVSRRELLRIVERIAETVAYAHAHGVVHRDLKPANVMLGPFGEVLVLDWGVARDVSGRDGDGAQTESAARSGTTDTLAGTVLGTPGYMAPEQAAGAAADERSDVYGLGAILRDLLAVHEDRVPGSLAAIRERAMATAPNERYQTALALRDDIRRWLDGERVSAHRESILDAAARIGAAYRTPIILVLAYLVMRLVILIWRGV